VALLERTHGIRIDACLAALVPASDRRLTRRVDAAGVPLVILGPEPSRIARVAGSMRRFAGLLRSREPDLVYPWLEQSALLAAPIARAFRVPVLVGRRNVSGPYADRAWPIVFAIHAAERLGALATANSEAVATETIRRGIPTARVRVVVNGYDLSSAAPLPCDDVVVLGYLARMRPEKGHRRLLAGLAALETDTPWRVDLAGDGPLRPEIEAEVERQGLSEKVRFLDGIEDPTGFWNRCDVALLLSDHEGSPNALIEAAGMGRPVVATAVGGIPEFIDDEVGILVDPEDLPNLASALRRIIEDRSLREQLGAAARARVKTRFSMAEFVNGHVAAIGEALEFAGR
jgi:glycosyltransferase involved in cell wall biosynthesis